MVTTIAKPFLCFPHKIMYGFDLLHHTRLFNYTDILIILSLLRINLAIYMQKYSTYYFFSNERYPLFDVDYRKYVYDEKIWLLGKYNKR